MNLKSLGCKAVRVQVPLWAPYKTQLNINELELKDSHPSGGFFVPEITLRFCFAINFRYYFARFYLFLALRPPEQH